MKRRIFACAAFFSCLIAFNGDAAATSEGEISVGQVHSGGTTYDIINGRQLERRQPASEVCQRSFASIDNAITIIDHSPEQQRVGQSPAFAAWADAARTLHAADCGGEVIEPQPDDTAECASLRQNARVTWEQLQTSDEFIAWRQLPQWEEIVDTVTTALSDDCYLDVPEMAWGNTFVRD